MRPRRRFEKEKKKTKKLFVSNYENGNESEASTLIKEGELAQIKRYIYALHGLARYGAHNQALRVGKLAL